MKSTTYTKASSSRVPFWKYLIGHINIGLILSYLVFASDALAAQAVSDTFIQSSVNSNESYKRVYNTERQFEKVEYIDAGGLNGSQTIESFHEKLKNFQMSSLGEPTYVPIINDGITIILPLYPLAKRIGDKFVQARFVRSQIYNTLQRNLLVDIDANGKRINLYANEKAQLNDLYNKAFEFAQKNNRKFGERVTEAEVNNFGKNFIWPELRKVNGEDVLVPIVHLTDATVDKLLVNAHVIEFSGENTNFENITVNASNVYAFNNTFLDVANDASIIHGGAIIADKGLKLETGGTLQILSGTVSARDNVDIVAERLHVETLVHRYTTRFGNAERLGSIAGVNSANGDVIVTTASDIVVLGGQVSGNNITFNASGNIRIGSVATSSSENADFGSSRWSNTTLQHVGSSLSAEQSIELIAAGAIEINASTLHADEGAIHLLAEQGVYIVDAQNETRSSRYSKYRDTTRQQREFQTIAIRSALEAGKNVVIETDFGDVVMRAADIKTGEGTSIQAKEGSVNFLLTKEQDHYFSQTVTEGTWKIKTTTQQDEVDTAVYNQIVGGVKVQAAKGVHIELAQYDNGSTQLGQQNTITAEISEEIKDIQRQIDWLKELGESTEDLEQQLADKSDELLNAQFAELGEVEGLSWMEELHNDPEFADNFSIAYQELVELHKFDSSSSLSPAAMAVIAIAVSVAMGPAGAGLIGSNGAIGAYGIISAPAMQAGALAIANQAAVGLASGQGVENTVKSLFHSDNIRATATAMVTAGVLEHFQNQLNHDFFGLPDDPSKFTPAQQAQHLVNQAATAVTQSAVRAGIATVIDGGSLGEFEDAFKRSLMQSGVDALGEYMAGEIGAAVHSEQGLNQALRYIAHAGVGCIIGAASGAVNDSQESNDFNCASGAGGAVVGELIADITVGAELAELEEKTKNLEQELKEMLIGEGLATEDNLDLNNLTEAQSDALRTHIQHLEASPIKYKKQFHELRAKGIDISKLGAGLVAFAAGADVNIAADAAENAVENNGFWFVAYGAVLLWKAYEIYALTQSVIDTIEKIDAAKTPEEREALLEELAKNLAIEAALHVSNGKLIDRLIKHAKDSKLGSEILLQLNKLKDKLENPDKEVVYEGGMPYYNSTSNRTSGTSPGGIPNNLSRGQLGDHIGEGGNKDVFAFGNSQAVGVLKKGANPKSLTDELLLLNKLDELGFPTVNARGPIDVDGSPALVYDRFAQGSKDVVKLDRGKVRKIGQSPLLNQRSIDDLKLIRKKMVDQKIKIDDLQFLIGRNGQIVIADPLDVHEKTKPSKNNTRMIDLLIEAARENT